MSTLKNSLRPDRDGNGPVVMAEHMEIDDEGHDGWLGLVLFEPIGLIEPKHWITLVLTREGDIEGEGRGAALNSEQARELGKALIRYADRAEELDG